MSAGNKNKSVDKAMEDVRKAILNKKRIIVTNTNKKRIINNNVDDILLLTEIYEESKIFTTHEGKVLKFKANIKNIIEPDVNEWLQSNLSNIVKNHTKSSIKSLNIKN